MIFLKRVYNTFEELASDYEKELLHPGDLKPALIKGINKLVQPVRDHFANDPKARKILELVKSFQVTK